MLKREITYEDFDGETKTEVFYFNMSKAELVELEVEYEKGFQEYLKDAIAAKNPKRMVEVFKKIVLMAYGEKSEDGKHFMKSDHIREMFAHTAAYQTLFLELALSDENKAVEFVQGILPKDLTQDQDKPAGPPLAPVPPTLPNPAT